MLLETWKSPKRGLVSQRQELQQTWPTRSKGGTGHATRVILHPWHGTLLRAPPTLPTAQASISGPEAVGPGPARQLQGSLQLPTALPCLAIGPAEPGPHPCPGLSRREVPGAWRWGWPHALLLAGTAPGCHKPILGALMAPGPHHGEPQSLLHPHTQVYGRSHQPGQIHKRSSLKKTWRLWYLVLSWELVISCVQY